MRLSRCAAGNQLAGSHALAPRGAKVACTRELTTRLVMRGRAREAQEPGTVLASMEAAALAEALLHTLPAQQAQALGSANRLFRQMHLQGVTRLGG